MRVVVAGGAGFIGSHLCRRLLAEGHHVLCIDNLSTGRRANIVRLEAQPGFLFIEHDVTQPLPPEVEGDAILHLASPASPPRYLCRPVETLLANSEGTLNLLEAARRNGARFLLASTSEVYGDPFVHPQREEYWGNVNPVGERSCYDEGKRFAEALAMAYARRHGVDVRIARIFNTYGEHSDPEDGRLVPNFITQALLGRPLTLYGSGEQTRSLCYVGDLVEGLVRLLFHQAARGEVVNLGNPDEHPVRYYAERIRDLCGSSSPIVTVEVALGDDPQRRRPDIAKARRLLGWQPAVPLDEGLRRTIAYFRAELARGEVQA